jgi:hypothetical protein
MAVSFTSDSPNLDVEIIRPVVTYADPGLI